MRLLELTSAGELSITADLLDNIPPYAILSHTWGEDEDEVTFNDLRTGSGKNKAGYAKITFCAAQARKDGIEHFWIDTCCIDKASSIELSEAINSMFRWYQQAAKCYVYLSDVTTLERGSAGQPTPTWISYFCSSRWFTRGWTLQELLAPSSVEFFSREGERLGDRRSLCDLIQKITGISAAALQGTAMSSFSVSDRLMWQSQRRTTRSEDQVYCLLGIFDVFMPILYGEGQLCWTRFKGELRRSLRYQLDDSAEKLITAMASATDDTIDRISHLKQEMLDSLQFAEMDAQRSAIKNPYSTTCAWFLEHDSYRAWLDRSEVPNHRGLLWINGKPGAGKSTLMKFVHANTEKRRAGNELVLSFFFNARGEELERSAAGMYRSLLVQLLHAAPDLQDTLEQFQPAFRTQRSSFTWDIEILKVILFSAVVRLGNRRLKCFVDALDECNEQEIRDMIVFWEDLSQAALDNGTELYACFAKRHYPTIEVRNGIQMVLEDDVGHNEDLIKYVRKHLQASKGKFAEEVRQEVCAKANGLFIWAVLVVNILNKELSAGRIFALKQRLRSIPGRMCDLFNDILRRDCTNQFDLLLCLQWLLFAKRPMGREEFYFAVISGLSADSDHLGAWDPDHVSTEDMERFILNSSKGLAQLTKGTTSTVQFVHESVRDFLLKDDILTKLSPESEVDLASASHERLKHCCLKYLRANSSRCLGHDGHLLKAFYHNGKDTRDTRAAGFPFLEYASSHLLYHANEAATVIPQDAFLKSFEQSDLHSLLSVLNALCPGEASRATLSASLPCVLAENGLARLLESARRTGMDLLAKGQRYHCPLGVAMANGHGDAIRALLSMEPDSAPDVIASLVELGSSFKNSQESSPITHAFKAADESICELLLKSGLFELDEPDRNGRDLLLLAADRRFERVARILLANRLISLSTTAHDGSTPLQVVASPEDASMVRLLLETGPHADELVLSRLSLSSSAAPPGHLDVVNMLLEWELTQKGDSSRYTSSTSADSDRRYVNQTALSQEWSHILSRMFITENHSNLQLPSSGHFKPGSVSSVRPGSNNDSGYSSWKAGPENEAQEDRMTEISFAETIRIAAVDRSRLIRAFVKEVISDLALRGDTWFSASENDVEALRLVIRVFGRELQASARPGLELRGSRFIRQQVKRIVKDLLFELSDSWKYEDLQRAQRSGDRELASAVTIEDWLDQTRSLQLFSYPDELSKDTSAADSAPAGGYDVCEDDAFSASSSSEDEEDLTDLLPYLEATKPFIKQRSAYPWLLRRVGQLLSPLAGVRACAETIMPYIGSVDDCMTMTFAVQWNPMAFIQTQYKSRDASLLARSITLTTDGDNIQAASCCEYVDQTWPSTGSLLLSSIIAALENVTEHDKNASNHDMPYRVTTHHSSGFIEVTVEGTCEIVFDTAEQLCWLGAACRASTSAASLSITRPSLACISAEGDNKCISIKFEEDLGASGWDTHGHATCWKHLFRNPTVATQFPVSKRSPGTSGLEIPLAMMAMLGETERLLDVSRHETGLESHHESNNNERLMIIKGFQSAFIPTLVSANSLTWHFVVNQDGSYLDASGQILRSAIGLDIDQKDLLKYRHFVGWVPAARSSFGTRDAKYESLRSTKAPRSGAGCALKDVQIQGGQFLTGSMSFTRGMKDEALWVSADRCYSQKVHQMRKMYVNFYDDRTQRGWLVDGASAALHIVRAQFCAQPYVESLASHVDRFKHACAFEDTECGRSAEQKALLDLNNRAIQYDEDSEYSREESSSQSEDSPLGTKSMSTNKRAIKIWTVENLVCQIWLTLEDLWRHQRKIRPVHLRGTTREKLEGWSLKQFIDSHPQLDPRVLHLPPSSRGWVDFLREINAVTLFGRDLGEMILPSPEIATCSSWQRMPEDRGLLAARVSTLRDICEEYGDEDASPLRLTKDIIWHQPHLLFEPCNCSKSIGKPLHKNCDRVQVLLPKVSLGSKTRPELWNSPKGAVILGRSERLKFCWPIRGKPVQGDMIDDSPVQDLDDMDSAIGTSIASSDI